MAMLIWRRLLAHETLTAACFALERAGSSIAARMAMIAITTSNSINVNPGSVLPSSFGFIVGFCRLSSMVILSLLCTLLGHGFAQGPPDPVEYHVAESFKSPVVPVAVRVAERRGEAATSGFALIGPGDNI